MMTGQVAQIGPVVIIQKNALRPAGKTGRAWGCHRPIPAARMPWGLPERRKTEGKVVGATGRGAVKYRNTGRRRRRTRLSGKSRMNHPNIAKVFEAGATEQSGPYFAMEYVAPDGARSTKKEGAE